MKKILPVFLCVVLVLSFGVAVTGCSPRIEYTSGDFLYWTIGTEEAAIVEIRGLSEQGCTKKVIVIPETIEGLPVCELVESTYYFGDHEPKFLSNELQKLYFSRSDVTIGQNAFENCTNLKQIFILEMVDNMCAFEARYYSNAKVYIFKDYYEEMAPSWTHISYKFAANVAYYYNYSDAPNRGCYWLDNLEEGEKIEILPSEPTRQSDGKEYIFGGWYLEKECINKLDVAKTILPASGELDLYAKWIEK